MAKSITQKASAKFAAEEKANQNIEKSILRAIDIQSKMEVLKEELDIIKQEMIDLFADKSESRLTTASGSVIIKTINNYSVEPKQVPALKDVFSSAFNAYITEKTDYKPTAAMRKLLDDADYPHSDLVRSSVLIKTYNQVVFEPVEKPVARAKKSA